ncbi:MAG: MBL fold metallo-hydrolase [Planctomycetota bacterium]|nr:MBL fold metallo-hydrolase [Planctomycetota bacterium]
MSLELLFLGTGTSAGVPMIGCDCDVCHSDDPRDHRTRPSVLVRYPAGDTDGSGSAPAAPPRQFVIDTGPDMRMQMIRNRVNRVDGVFYTHTHADHIFGLDDLRRFNSVMNGPIDLYVERSAQETLESMFKYVFEAHKNLNQSWVPKLNLRRVEPGGAFDLHGGRWTPVRLMHGKEPVLGFRVDLPDAAGNPLGGGSLAYCTDVSLIPPETFPLLAGLDVLVIDGLRYTPHPTHMTVEQALALIERIAPREAYLTHMAHDIRYTDLEPKLPKGVHLSYDGLTVNCLAVRRATMGLK